PLEQLPLSLTPSNGLPRFERPPVIETVLGVQFHPISRFTNGHLGAFWKRLGPEWPFIADAPPIQHQFQRFGPASWARLGLQMQLSQIMRSRLQIRNAAKDRMIQVQNGRFHYNWLGEGGGKYPRYREVRPAFDQALGEFRRFLTDELQADLQPNQW